MNGCGEYNDCVYDAMWTETACHDSVPYPMNLKAGANSFYLSCLELRSCRVTTLARIVYIPERQRQPPGVQDSTTLPSIRIRLSSTRHRPDLLNLAM